MKILKKQKNNKIILQIFSLVIAIVLWSYVLGIENPVMTTTFRRVNINYSDFDSLNRRGLKLMNESIPVVNVTVRGKKSDLDNMTGSNIEATLNLSGAIEGEHNYNLNVALRGAANSVSIVKVDPPEMLLNLESIVTRAKPVKVLINGKVAPGHELGNVVASVPMVNVSGPRSWINDVEYLQAEINVDGKEESFTINSNIKPVNHDGQDVSGVEMSISTVAVDVSVYNVKTVPVKPVIGKDADEGFAVREIKIVPENVTIRSLNSLDDIEYISTEPIDLTAFKENNTIQHSIILPEEATLSSGDLKVNVEVKLSKINTKELRLFLGTDALRNMPENLKLVDESFEHEIVVLLKGFEDELKKVEASDIRAYIDLKDAVKGENFVEIIVEPINEVKEFEVTPGSIILLLEDKNGNTI